jgi:hypothetical protein
MRLRIKEVQDMVLVKIFKTFTEAQKFITEYKTTNEKFVVGYSAGDKPAVYVEVSRKIYY